MSTRVVRIAIVAGAAAVLFVVANVAANVAFGDQRSPSGLATYRSAACTMMNLGQVTLTARDGATWADDVEVAWPMGYTSAPTTGGDLVVLDPGGREVLRTGVPLDGVPGSQAGDHRWHACP